MHEQTQDWEGTVYTSPPRICLTLPLPPSINEQYATVNGHRVSTQVARRFKRTVHAVLRQLERQGKLSEALHYQFQQSHLALLLDCYFTTPLRRDLDGGLKITQDAICEGLGLNDNRVVDIHLMKHIDPLHPHLYVELETVPDWHFDKEYVLLS
ncbi:RusA family crossover junction endodeoxyribonuclease [Dictyobacter kobayashii]|uniref:Uncharacterized protein n=1 Tax=Dictyobacter kobayashii TaxID=2014872 RepID=A0A402AFY6_9CHLR|nr:RusA family crossover junction endodeoxyribonuclease [Dictyobacter kobayashii]GCE18027.1 hypothetical protein KDK_18270 [Dictyobacter kobayashii]